EYGRTSSKSPAPEPVRDHGDSRSASGVRLVVSERASRGRHPAEHRRISVGDDFAANALGIAVPAEIDIAIGEERHLVEDALNAGERSIFRVRPHLFGEHTGPIAVG